MEDANTTNPYVLFERVIFGVGRPPPTTGINARLLVLICLLGYMALASIVLLVLNVVRARQTGKSSWMFRIVRRPQGRYLQLNQYLCGPLCCLAGAGFWMGYVFEMRDWWLGGPLEPSVIYWFGLNTIPVLTITSAITFAVISTANLASSRKSNPSHHIVGPVVMNSIGLVLSPLSVAALVLTSSRTGQAWKDLHVLLVKLCKQAHMDGLAWTGNLTMEEAQAMLLEMEQKAVVDLTPTALRINSSYRISSICYAVCIGIVCLINIWGAFLFLSSLRLTETSQLVWKSTPIVAPLGPLASSSPSLPSESLEKNDIERVASDWSGEELVGSHIACPKGRSLDWHMTLLYFGFTGVSLLSLAYAIWLAIKSMTVFIVDPQVEVAAFAVQWVSGGAGSFIVTALAIKRVHQLLTPVKPFSPTMEVVDDK